MQVYFKNNNVTFLYDKEAKLGKAVWRGRLQGPELREAYLLLLDMIDRFALTRWLADDRLMEAISPADLRWSLEVYVPRVASSALLRMARLPSQFEENLQSVEVMIDKGHTYDLNLLFRDFSDEQEALAWLMEPL
ncbi:hypothetical protein [Pontibacter actiniarum]|uniref:STAS/SEC14 domain-containing protein n=1 Tax=Pontibacter actiniarum TaxID=323450 RepID=A0A1X9YVN3_9BACT|nr:hypothetical protein [Pontibacter actiniarum]ARS36955.1 hypothetical protein CA264_16815 [Pontibacter actiniarum]